MPTPDSIYGALAPDIGAGAGALPSDALISAMERLAAGRRQQLSFPPAAPGPAPAPVMSGALGPQSSLGQKYQNYPAATFEERFGPYIAEPGMSQEDQIRQLFDKLRFRDTPEAIIPGRRTYPFGYTII